MRYNFTAEQIADPQLGPATRAVRACVHCGFCTATCPTYVILGDELDSPRGRIYLMKEMLENEREPTPEVVKHIDRCLSCLSCMTTCPSGVNYMHLVDHARAYVEDHKGRSLPERMFRAALVKILSNRTLFRAALLLAALAKPFQFILPKQLKAMVGDAPAPKTPG